MQKFDHLYYVKYVIMKCDTFTTRGFASDLSSFSPFIGVARPTLIVFKLITDQSHVSIAPQNLCGKEPFIITHATYSTPSEVADEYRPGPHTVPPGSKFRLAAKLAGLDICATTKRLAAGGNAPVPTTELTIPPGAGNGVIRSNCEAEFLYF